MIINVGKLTDFVSGHSLQAEIAVMNALCFLFDLEPRGVTKGNDARYDFMIQNTKIELKVSSKGVYGLIELSRADGSPSGLSATEADIHAFLNPAGRDTAKLRLIHTYELLRFYDKFPEDKKIITRTNGDKLGSVLAPFDIRNFEDLFVAECKCNFTPNGLEFDTSTFKANSFGRTKIGDYIK